MDNDKKSKDENIFQGDITQDSFFDNSLDNVDLSSLDNIDLSKIKITPDEVRNVVEEDINISLPKLKPKYIPVEPVVKEPKVEKETKETKMKKILDSIGAGDDSNNKDVDPLKDFWSTSTDDSSEYKIQLHRLEPQMLKGQKIAGYLDTFYLPTTVPDIIEKVGRVYGGGRYQLKIVDGSGKYVKMKTFEIAGLPKFEDKKEEPSTTSAPSPTPIQPPNSSTSFFKNSRDTRDEELDEDLSDDSDESDDDYSDYFKKKTPLRPRASGFQGGGFGGGYPGGGYPNINPFQGGFRRPAEEDLEAKLESKINTKIDSLNEKLSNIVNQVSSKKESNSILSPELLQAAMPLIGTFLESKRGKDDMLAQQFSEMNNRMVTLFQGIQDMSRNNEKSKEDILEKERREREQARKEWQETQEKQEQRFRDMMMTMQSSLEKRFGEEANSQRSVRDEYEKQREDARRRQDEFFEKMRQKEEEARLKIEEIREQARKAEIEKERETRRAELELIERMRTVELEKIQYQQDHMRKSYSDNVGTKEYEYKMQLALRDLDKERAAQLQDLKAQMEIEKLKQDAKLELARIKQESEEKKGSEDAFDKIMAEYLRRRLQIMMMRDLEGVEAEPEDGSPVTPGKVFNNVLNQGTHVLGNLLQQILGGGLSVEPRQERQGRVVEPKPSKTKVNPQATQPNPSPPPNSTSTSNTTNPPVSSEAVSEDVDESELEEEISEGMDLGDLASLGPELAAEVDKIGKYFNYLKESIEQNRDPKESAEAGKQQLMPQIAQYLGTIEDSRVVIQELQGLLDPELAEFFLQETSTVWLDKLLTYFREE